MILFNSRIISRKINQSITLILNQINNNIIIFSLKLPYYILLITIVDYC